MHSLNNTVLIVHCRLLCCFSRITVSCCDIILQADAPITAREGLRDSADKKNPGEEGYGGLQGRATASYSPDVTR